MYQNLRILVTSSHPGASKQRNSSVLNFILKRFSTFTIGQDFSQTVQPNGQNFKSFLGGNFVFWGPQRKLKMLEQNALVGFMQHSR